MGEVCVKGAAVIKGYLNRPEATAETIVDGWLHTGDIGYFDEEGFLYLVDRAKDMILRGGENIYGAEVEFAVFDHPAVLEVVAFAVPDERLGEEVGGNSSERRRHVGCIGSSRASVDTPSGVQGAQVHLVLGGATSTKCKR